MPSKDISQTVTTNMDDLVDEIKDYDSQMKSEFSEMKKQESFRREFIGNLAHEIKTPLFTSQSYLLTLLDGALDDESVNKKYLKTEFIITCTITCQFMTVQYGKCTEFSRGSFL